MKTLFALIASALLGIGGAFAATADEVRAAEEAFAKAVASGSAPELNRLLSPDFVYQHTTGNNYSRADIVRIFTQREITVSTWGPLEATFKDYGNTVVAFGSRRIAGDFGTTPYGGTLRFVNVWHRQPGGAWQMTHRSSQLLTTK